MNRMDDSISRQAAIEAIKKNTFRLTVAEEQNAEGHVAWNAYVVYSDVAEGSLLELPSVQSETNCSKIPNNSDTISRQAAIDALDKRFDDVPMELTTEILQLRRDLRERIPSAQPPTNCSEIPNGSDDTISRRAAIDALADMHCKSDEDGYVWIIRSDAWARIDALPSAQPHQIVRCKDCKWGAQDEDGWWYCVEIGGRMGDGKKGDGFCSDAERRTDDQTDKGASC